MTAQPQPIGVVINSILRLLTRYMAYRTGPLTNATPVGDADDMLAKGQQEWAIVRTGVSQYGNSAEKDVLAAFEREPHQHVDQFGRTLTDIAMRAPVFQQQIESLVAQLDLPTA